MTGALIDGHVQVDGRSAGRRRGRRSSRRSRRTSSFVALASATSIRPAPKSNGSAGVVRSSLTTSVVAVVIRADLIWPGVHDGCLAISRMAAPATCGDDIDVPGDRLEVLAGRPFRDRLRRRRHAGQDLDAGCGDVRLDEQAGRSAGREGGHDVALAVLLDAGGELGGGARVGRQERQRSRCRRRDGRSAASGCRSRYRPAAGLYRIMPAAPPWRTLKPLSTRALTPRWQATILPGERARARPGASQQVVGCTARPMPGRPAAGRRRR